MPRRSHRVDGGGERIERGASRGHACRHADRSRSRSSTTRPSPWRSSHPQAPARCRARVRRSESCTPAATGVAETACARLGRSPPFAARPGPARPPDRRSACAAPDRPAAPAPARVVPPRASTPALGALSPMPTRQARGHGRLGVVPVVDGYRRDRHAALTSLRQAASSPPANARSSTTCGRAPLAATVCVCAPSVTSTEASGRSST